MAEEQEKIVLEVDIDTQKVQQELSAAVHSLQAMKEEQKRLTNEITSGNDANGEMARQLALVNKRMDENKRIIKSHTALLQADNKAVVDNTMSLNDQRQTLKEMQNAYAALSGDAKAAADAEGGLRDQIKALSDSVKEQEMAMGDARRNVGNYTESILAAADKSATAKQALEGLGMGGSSAAKGFDMADKFGKAFAKNPVMAIIMIVGTLLAKMADALKQNDEAMQGVKVATASMGGAFNALKPIINTLSKVFVDVFLKALNWVMDAIKSVLGWVDALAKKFGKDLGLVAAFEAGAEAAHEETEEIKSETSKQVNIRKEAANEIDKLREEMAKRRRTDMENAIAELEKQKDAELKTKGLTEQEKAEITEYYAAKEQEIRDNAEEEYQKQLAAEVKAKEDAEKAKLDARNKALLALGLEEGMTPEQAELAALNKYYQDDLINREEYEKAASLIHEKYANQRAEETEAEVERAAEAYESATKSAASATGAALSALSSLLSEYSEQSEGAAKAQKAFALGAVLVNQALSVAEGAKGIAAAMAGAAEAAAATGPAAPVMLAVYQAQMVGQVLSVVTSVASSIVQAKQILSSATDAGKFAIGGIIGGTSYTGDKMIAHVNSGEAVITKQQQARLLEIANSSMQGVDYSAMSAAFAAAVAAQPAPVMNYAEFSTFEGKVATYNEIASI